MQKTEKHMPRRTNHNPRMPSPHHQIRGLRLRHPLKSFHAVIKIVRTRIGIRKSRALINRMHQMRAVVLRKARRLRIERRSNHRQLVIRTQRLSVLLPTPLSRSRIRHRLGSTRRRTYRRLRPAIVPDPPRPVLRARNTKRKPTQPSHQRGLSRIPHGPIVMPIPPSAMVTIVQRPDRKLLGGAALLALR